jgi:sulfotransferase family protein
LASNSEVRPGFFIVGAPRCGTTALSTYLVEHPRIGFSMPKETQFFCTDLPGISFHTADPREYLKLCFGHCAGKNYLAIGEGSVWNLYSKDALANILRFNPEARFIIMVRNPIELCVALYEKRREMLQEDQLTFEQAWRLEEERLQNRNVPSFFRKEVGVAGYRSVALLGEQVERAFYLIPPAQRLLIVFDDFVVNTAAVYAQVLNFLGVPHDGRKEFAKINEGQSIRNPRLWTLIWGTLLFAYPLLAPVKRKLKVPALNIYPRLSRLFLGSRQERPVIPEPLRAEMRAHFGEDIKRLSAAVGRDLSHWR